MGNALIGISLPLLSVGAILYWNVSSTWAPSPELTRANNTAVFALPLLWICAALAAYSRSRCMNGMAFIFILVCSGIVSFSTVSNDYISPSLANYARLLLDQGVTSVGAQKEKKE